MNEPLTSDPAWLDQLDELITEFDTSFHRETRRPIEAYVANVPEYRKSNLFASLLRVELTHRIRLGETPTVADYCGRFDNYADILNVVIGEFSQILRQVRVGTIFDEHYEVLAEVARGGSQNRRPFTARYEGEGVGEGELDQGLSRDRLGEPNCGFRPAERSGPCHR